MTVASAARRPPRVRPYPLDALPRLLRVQVELSQVLWGHVAALLGAAHVSTTDGRAALERRLGGPLQVDAQAPYLLSADRLPALVRSAHCLDISRVAPSPLRFLLALDSAFGQALGITDAARWVEPLQSSLRGAGVQVVALDAEGVLARLADPGLRSALVLDATVRVGPQAGWARLIGSAALRIAVPPTGAALAARSLWAAHDRLAGASVQLVLEAGYGFLRSQEILDFAVDDVVLLDHFGPRPVTGGPVWLRLGSGVFPGHLDGAGVTVIGSFYLRAQAMADQQSDEPASTSETAETVNESLLRELPVQVTCEIGRVTLSAKEVLELRPGAVLPVGRPLAGPVDLTAGGRVLARGELVDVEGEIGVRITEIVS